MDIIKKFLKGYWKNILIYTIMMLFTILSVWHLDVLTQDSFHSKLISLFFLVPFFAGFLFSKFFPDEEQSEKDTVLCKNSVLLFTTIGAVALLLVRYFDWITGIQLPGTISVHHTDGSITGYMFDYFLLQYPLSFCILYNNIINLREKFILQSSIMIYIQNIAFAFIDARLFFVITAVTWTMNFVFNRRTMDKSKWIFLVINALLAVVFLAYALHTQGYILRDDFSLLKTVSAISVVVINSIMFLILSFIQKRGRIKYFFLSLFLLIGIVTIPHLLMSFNAEIWGIVLFLSLYNDEDEFDRLDLYAKWLITNKKAPNIKKMLYDANKSKVTITADALSSIIIENLVGGNYKYLSTVRIFDELEVSESELNFELYMIKALLAEAQSNPRASIFYKKAVEKSRGNVEYYIAEYFSDIHTKLEDIEEDLDGEQLQDVRILIEKYSALLLKLKKLKN